MSTFVKIFHGHREEVETEINKYTFYNEVEIVSINFQLANSTFCLKNKTYEVLVVFKKREKLKTIKGRKNPKIGPLKPIFSPPATI